MNTLIVILFIIYIIASVQRLWNYLTNYVYSDTKAFLWIILWVCGKGTMFYAIFFYKWIL